MNREPLTVSLPVCPTCLHAGKIPSTPSRRDFCTGGLKNHHRSTKMTSVLFKEVVEDQEEEQ